MGNVVGHFPPAERRRLWALLAPRLAPAGRGVLNLYPPTRPETAPATPMAEMAIGRRRYSGSASAEPGSADSVDLDDVHRLTEDERVITEFSAAEWWVLTSEQLTTELAAHGLRVRAGDLAQRIQVVTR